MTYVPYEQDPQHAVQRVVTARFDELRRGGPSPDIDLVVWDVMLTMPFALVGNVLDRRSGGLLDKQSVDILRARAAPPYRGRVGYCVGQSQRWAFPGLLCWELVVAMLPGWTDYARGKAGPGSEVRNAMRMTFEACDIGGVQTIRALCMLVAMRGVLDRGLWRDACFLALDALPEKRR